MMKITGINTLVMCLTSLVLAILILAEPSHQQVAWRPQGRFGKRNYMDPRLSNELISSKLREIHDQEQGLAKGLKILAVPHFEADGILCIASDDQYQKGIYRCFTVNPDVHSPNPLSLLNAPLVELDGVLCVNSGGKGNYRCLQFVDQNALASQ